MKRYGCVKLGDKTHRPGCPCCTTKYSHGNNKHRGGKKRERQAGKRNILNDLS